MHVSLFAQDKLQIISGTVRNSDNYEPISFAHVHNEMLRTDVISDEQGRFSIPFNQGNLLKITAIGFEDGFYIISDSSSIVANFPIQLKPRIYELKEFTLTPYKTVMQFKHALIQLKLPEENPSLISIITPNRTTEPTQFEEVLGAFGSPISFFYNNFSHKGKMMKKYNRLIAKDKEYAVIYKRLNFDFVSRIVPINNKVEFEAFLEFCDFDLSYLHNVSDYDLVATVQKKYAEYLQQKLLYKPLDSLN